MHPVEADGCGLVILAENARFLGAPIIKVLETGTLSYDGEALTLESDNGGRRIVTEEEQRDMLNVTEQNQIPQCVGYDFFILRQAN